jgi:hypothetical protein
VLMLVCAFIRWGRLRETWVLGGWDGRVPWNEERKRAFIKSYCWGSNQVRCRGYISSLGRVVAIDLIGVPSLPTVHDDNDDDNHYILHPDTDTPPSRNLRTSALIRLSTALFSFFSTCIFATTRSY